MKKGVFRKELECVLSDDEVKTYSGELARLTQQQAELTDRKKEIAAEYKAKIDACVADTRVIARKISTGKEMRDVECEWDYQYRENVKVLRRLDTKEVIDTKALTEDERQMCLDYEEQQQEQMELEEGAEDPMTVGQDEAGEVVETVEPETFECQECKKKKRAKKCGADCRQV